MPRFLSSIFTRTANPNSAGTAPLNRYSGFTNDGVVITNRRGTKRVGIPDAEGKAFGMGSDPLAIYRPAGAKTVSAAKAMGNGWIFAAVNAIASEVATIQLRLYQVKGDKHEEVTDHALLDLLDGINQQMTGIEFRYTMMAHLELTGNFYCLLDGVTNETTPPRALHPLNPGSVRVKVDKTSFPYPPHPGDDARRMHVTAINADRGQRRQFEKCRSRIYQEIDALARQHLAARGMPGARRFAAAGHAVEHLAQFCDRHPHGFGVRSKL
jgi:hypothetical protein